MRHFYTSGTLGMNRMCWEWSVYSEDVDIGTFSLDFSTPDSTTTLSKTNQYCTTTQLLMMYIRILFWVL